jgi:hypothetical protein
MTAGPTSDALLGDYLHNNPNAYWCPDCWAFTLDCPHLVRPLDAPELPISDWQINSVAYDRARRILELEMNTGERFQHFGVPRDIAVMLVKAKSPAAFLKEAIDARYPFKRVRIPKRFC